jgi:membrane protein insertase Oxa1/YidC/SpoIIIJ
MKVTVGFCEIALVTSLFFFKESWWVGVILLTIAILGKLLGFALSWHEKQENSKSLKKLNESLAKSLTSVVDNQATQALKNVGKKSQKKSTGIPDFIFDNYVDKDKPN